MAPELCPRMFGDSELDIRHFGQIPICMDSRQVRCCGASFSVEVSGIPSHITRSRQVVPGKEASANNTQWVQTKTQLISAKQHANNSRTTLHFVTGQQPKGTVGPEDSSNNFNTTVQMENNSKISPNGTMNHARLQQSKYIRNPEEIQKDSNAENSDSIIVFPRHMTGKYDSSEPEAVFLVYPSKNNENNWNTNMMDAGSLSSNMAELQLFESENDKNKYLTEIPVPLSNDQIFTESVDLPEKEYLVASGSEYKGVRAHNEMQQDLEDDQDEESGGGGSGAEEEEEEEEDQVETPLQEQHTLKDDIQSKRPNIPKRSFVSKNLKMRISQLATADRRPTPRCNPAAYEAQRMLTRYLMGPKSGQLSHSIRGTEKQPTPQREAVANSHHSGSSPLPAKTRTLNHNTRPEANRNMPDTSSDRKTGRSRPQRLRSNTKPSTRIAQNRATTLHTSKSRNTFFHQLDTNHTHRTVSNPGTLQPQGGHLHQEFVGYQMQENETDMTFPQYRQIHLKRNSEVMPELMNEGQRTVNTNLFITGDNPKVDSSGSHSTNTKSTGTEGIQSSARDKNDGIVENSRYPMLFRRKATDTTHRTFGARTRTRDRPPSFHMRTEHVHTKAEGGKDSGIMKFTHNQQTGQDVAKHHPSELGEAGTPVGITTVTTLGMDTGGSGNEEYLMEGTGEINVVGPIPKGFTDPVTIQNTDSFNQRGSLFLLPHPTKPEPFQNQILNSKVPLVSIPVTSTSAALPSSGVTSFNQGVEVFHQPHAQTFQQHYTFRNSETHPPQKYIQTTIIMSNSPNTENVNQHKWQIHQQKQLVSDQQFHFSPSQVQSSMIALTSNLPLMQNLTEFRKPPQFHLSHDPQKVMLRYVPVAILHSSPNDESIRAKIVPLPQTPPVQKFLSFSNQQLKQPGNQKEDLLPQHTHASQLPPKSPVPLLFALYQQDAAHHAAQFEYTKKLQEYFQQLQSYYKKQHHP
jgi:hypothetical protein